MFRRWVKKREQLNTIINCYPSYWWHNNKAWLILVSINAKYQTSNKSLNKQYCTHMEQQPHPSGASNKGMRFVDSIRMLEWTHYPTAAASKECKYRTTSYAIVRRPVSLVLGVAECGGCHQNWIIGFIIIAEVKWISSVIMRTKRHIKFLGVNAT